MRNPSSQYVVFIMTSDESRQPKKPLLAGCETRPRSTQLRLFESRRLACTPLSPAGQQVQEVAIIVLGLWVLASALPDTAYWLSMVMFTSGAGFEAFTWLPENKANIVATALEVVIGFILFFGARGLSNLLYRIRYGNTPAAQ